ncbi:MAG: zf-HC2 domain-containing protein [Vicinamibacterales bacterium]
MSDPFVCDDKDTLIAYLYDEIDPVVRRRVEEHLRVCAACTAEVTALSSVRVELASWTAPEVELDFQFVRKSAAVWRPAAWWSGIPVWAQAAAAIFVLAVSAAIANVQVRSGTDGLVVSTGWMAPASAAPAAVAVPDEVAHVAADEAWKPALAALETQLRNEIRSGRDNGTNLVRASARTADDATLKNIELMIEASERRQRQEMALRLTQFNRDVNMQRQADLVKIDQIIGQYAATSGAELAQQRRTLNYLTRVSNPQQ